jgi:hypothetical protein
VSAPPLPSSVSSLQRTCPQCARPAALGRRFCGGCRAVLVRPCAACGFGNERDDVWCGGCGASVSPRSAVGASPPTPPVGPARPPAIPSPPSPPSPPARIHAPALDRGALGDLEALVAINARRAPSPPSTEAADQDHLDELFGEVP